MRIFVVSDTHGRIDDFLKAVRYLEKPDFFIHLGDHVEDGIKIEKEMNVEAIIVKGNCDYTREFPEEKVLNINGKKILITHGHKQNVKFDTSRLLYAAKEKDVDLVLFGHTHISLFTEKDGIMFMNPGSPSIPRLPYEKTFGILDVEKKISGKIVEIK